MDKNLRLSLIFMAIMAAMMIITTVCTLSSPVAYGIMAVLIFEALITSMVFWYRYAAPKMGDNFK